MDKSGIKFSQWNKGPAKLTKRIPNIDLILSEHNPHILVINEANVNLEELKNINFPNYTIEADSLITTSGQARTLLLVHKDINYVRCHSLEPQGLSSIWIKAGLKQQRKIMFNGFYRQWRVLNDVGGVSHKISEQRSRLKRLLQPWAGLSVSGMETIAIGDINLPDQDITDHQSVYHKKMAPLIKEYQEMLADTEMIKISTSRTRQMQGQEDTSPDQIHVSNPAKMTSASITNQSDSENQLVSITRKTKNPILKPRYRLTRRYQNLDMKEYKVQLLQDHRYLASILETDPTLAVSHLQSLLQDKLDDVAPLIKVQINKKSDHQIRHETLMMMKERDEARLKARRTKDPDDWRLFRNIRNNVTTKLHNEYTQQDKNALDSKKNNPAELWANAKRLSGWESRSTPRRIISQGRHHDSPKDIAHILNQEYISRAEDIADSIPKTDLNPMDNYRRMLKGKILNMTLTTISLAEMNLILKSMKPTKSTSADGLSMKLVKGAAQVLAKPLLNIVNQSIVTNTFPDNLKLSKIVPILKANKDPSIPHNYRPINLLSPISKIIEKVIVRQLVNHVVNNKLIPANHTGSRPKQSTTTTAMTLHEIWSEILEDDMEAVILQLDQSAAYDIVPHDIMIQKLEALGLDKDAVSWFTSYMSGRSQQVYVEAVSSPPIKTGPRSVIQGSVLSCVLYLLYIMDMPCIFHTKNNHTFLTDSRCQNATSCTYVDDINTTIRNIKNDPDGLNRKLDENLETTKKYMEANRLALNREKTKIFVIAKHPDRKKQIKLTIADKTILHTRTINVLGITFNDKLNWEDHTVRGKSSILTQLKSRLTVLKKLTKMTGRSFARQLANGIIMGKVEYAIALWGNSPKYQIQMIQKLVNKAARTVIGPCSLRWSIDHLMKEMGWLKLTDLIKYHQASLAHQVVFHRSPEFIHEKLNPKDGATRSHRGYKLGPKPNSRGQTTYTKNNFTSTIYEMYNKLPSILTSIPPKTIFKTRLRRYFVNNDDVPNNTDRVYGNYLDRANHQRRYFTYSKYSQEVCD